MLTTPSGVTVPFIPAPKDIENLSSNINGEVWLNQGGSTMLDVNTKTRRDDFRLVVMFDLFVEPTPESWCVETEFEELLCDFENAPLDMQPGIHFPPVRTRAKLDIQTAKVVYSDGTSQKITPTVWSPDTFIEETMKLEEVEKISLNSNGTFYLLYKGKPYIILPNFDVVVKNVPKQELSPEVAFNDKNIEQGLLYSFPTRPVTSNTRRSRTDIMEILLFKPFIEPAPESWCVEIDENEIFCDFENIPLSSLDS
ncbi:hypothetical protein QUF74_19835 [Candidatus Halobeggiatoa sp. HSG11]|nr:hypothetical protein [Candidatus Halobeggiatoa sp. HSG11]